MRELSVFIDESGDFGEVKERPAYYLVTFIFHEQEKKIQELVLKLEEQVERAGFQVSFVTVIVDRREAASREALLEKLARSIHRELMLHQGYLMRFDKIIVYYDNGQNELREILKAVFFNQFSTVEFRKAEPQKYRLLQAADFICSLELLKIKRQENRLSRSEKQFFYKPQELKKIFLRSIEKKRLTLL